MSLRIGTQFGSYEITALLGKGGMGEVWKARDKKLGREVAIKILPDDLVDAAARRRFQREAQMASSLNHPHILTFSSCTMRMSSKVGSIWSQSLSTAVR